MALKISLSYTGVHKRESERLSLRVKGGRGILQMRYTTIATLPFDSVIQFVTSYHLVKLVQTRSIRGTCSEAAHEPTSTDAANDGRNDSNRCLDVLLGQERPDASHLQKVCCVCRLIVSTTPCLIQNGANYGVSTRNTHEKDIVESGSGHSRTTIMAIVKRPTPMVRAID